MPQYQLDNTYTNSPDVFRGNAAVEISRYQASPSYTPVGAHIGLSIQRNLETTEEETDNSQGETKVFKDEVTVTFNRLEVLTDALNRIIMDELDDFETTAGTPVAGATQVITSGDWSYSNPIVLSGQNGDGTQPTINSVTGSVDGALSATAGDYSLHEVNNVWYVTLHDTVTVTTEAQNITVDSDYTPAASVTQKSGNGTDLNKVILKITSKNDGRQVVWYVWLCQLTTVGELALQADDAEDRRLQEPVTFIGRPDYTYHSDGADGAYTMWKVTDAS